MSQAISQHWNSSEHQGQEHVHIWLNSPETVCLHKLFEDAQPARTGRVSSSHFSKLDAGLPVHEKVPRIVTRLQVRRQRCLPKSDLLAWQEFILAIIRTKLEAGCYALPGLRSVFGMRIESPGSVLRWSACSVAINSVSTPKRPRTRQSERQPARSPWPSGRQWQTLPRRWEPKTPPRIQLWLRIIPKVSGPHRSERWLAQISISPGSWRRSKGKRSTR